MTEQSKPKLSPHQVREVAVKAKCNPVTVRRWLNGEPIQALSLDRIQGALKLLGYAS